MPRPAESVVRPQSLSPTIQGGAAPAPDYPRTSHRKAAVSRKLPAGREVRTPCNGSPRRVEHSEHPPAFPMAFPVSGWKSKGRYNTPHNGRDIS